MGTVTSSSSQVYSFSTKGSVKLNNPLMGTETILFCVSVHNHTSTPVKLNNPLMGTETSSTSQV